ncbi:MAG: hypothetical protein KDB27_15955, partial [Planctomycetales bacterium]|nr:hypothetical protein [Planctomycetales bacterium]
DPSAARLDRIWELHKSRDDESVSLKFEKEGDAFVYNATFDALRECAVLDLTWLENAIVQSELADPVHDLAYLVAHVEDNELWLRVRKMLFDKVASDRPRSLACNVGQYRDRDYLDWLLAQLSVEDDLVGPVALDALVNIDPDAARKSLGKIDPFRLASTSKWNFHRLVALDEESTQSAFLVLLREQKSPWQLADAYRDGQNLMGQETLTFLLDELEAVIEVDLLTPESKRYSWRPIELISSITAPSLLECIKRRRGSSLEKKLVEWFYQLGPRQSVHGSGELSSCIRLLELVGGEGFTTVVNELLKAGNFYGRLDGLKISSHRQDRQTIVLLAERMRSDGTHEGQAIEQGYAAAALADLGEWPLVVEYIGKYGLQGLDRVYDYHGEFESLPDSCIALLGLSDARELTEGQIEAIGFSGRADHADKIIETLIGAPLDSDLAHACILAIRRLELKDHAAVELLESQLGVEKHRRDAAVALYVANTDEALEILFQQLQNQYDHAIAVNLLRDNRTKERVLEHVQAYLTNINRFDTGPIDTLLYYVRDEDTLKALFGDSTITSHLKKHVLESESSFVWHTGSKATQIRALATVDPAFAYTAATEAFRQKGNHDRNYYPSILVQIAPERSRDFLIQHLLETDDSTLVRWAIGEALNAVDADEAVLALAQSDNSNERFVACCLAERYECGELVEQLRRLVLDPTSKIANAALVAYREQKRLMAACELASAFNSEREVTHRWNLLRTFVETAPADSHHPGNSKWLQMIANDAPQGMWKFAVESQKMRRDLEKQVAYRRDSV